jgi:uncharacterized protein (TIRG00374 family)
LPHAWGRRLAIGLGLAALVYLGFASWAGWDDLREAVTVFRWPLVLPALLLSLVNYGVRFARWHIYLQRSAIVVPAPLSAKIFFCGLVMSVTPGKLGEVLKAWLVKVHAGTPMTRTAPVVVAERITDLAALVVLLFIGSILVGSGWLQLLLSGAITAALLAALAWPPLARAVLHIAERIGFLRRHVERLEAAYESMRFLLRPRLLVEATLLGAVAWFAECVGFWVILHGFAIDESLPRATFIYAFSTLVGALLLLPGGVGGTEGSMVAMLVADGARRPHAVAATFLCRAATLWFAVLCGALVLLGDRRLMARSAERA